MELPGNAMIMRKETIKPFSPTPTTKKTLKLSLLDQFAPVSYVPLILFYPTIPNPAAKISQTLRTSLSKTLVHFYPFAGRIIDDSYVDCNDTGVEFIEAQTPYSLSDFLKSPDADGMQQQFLPMAMESEEALVGCLLHVQCTLFSCGGFVIGVCVSHKIADAATLSTFIKCWSAMARNDCSDQAMMPVFMGDSLIPQSAFSDLLLQVEFEQGNTTLRRFLFDATNIAALKAKAATTTSGAKPTSVEAVSALMWKCLIKASRANMDDDQSRSSALFLPVNLRKRFVPPLPQNYAGNYLAIVLPLIHEQTEFKEVVHKIKKEIQRLSELDVKTIGRYITDMFIEYGNLLGGDDIADAYTFSSWCKFGFYEADFGYGKPSWCAGGITFKNFVTLMDTKDGQGIEVWVAIDKDEMALLQSDQGLLEFATLNPPVTC